MGDVVGKVLQTVDSGLILELKVTRETSVSDMVDYLGAPGQ